MLTPTITEHWSDGRRLHVIGTFGGAATPHYLRNEDTLGLGSKVKWPLDVKSSRAPIFFITSDNFGTTPTITFLLTNSGNTSYVKIYSAGVETADDASLADVKGTFYAIFKKW